MSIIKILPVAAILSSIVFAETLFAEELNVNLGEPASASEIESLSLTVFPDGEGLPVGEGSVERGKSVYAQQCAYCHGATAVEGPAARLAGSEGFFSFAHPARILRVRKNPLLAISAGARWPYATSIFDYTRRAMPHNSPKSLTTDEVYALTAYLLYLNDIVDSKAVLNQDTLPKVQMPGYKNSISAWVEE